MKENEIIIGLCKSQVKIQEVEEYIYDREKIPTIGQAEEIARDVLIPKFNMVHCFDEEGCDHYCPLYPVHVTLYANYGTMYMLSSVIKAIKTVEQNYDTTIKLTIMHMDFMTGEFVPQEI